MTFDSIVLAAISAELNRTLAGGRVDKIYQPSPLNVVLTIRNNSANHMLLISADAESPRIHLTTTKHPNPQNPPNFCMLLRKYLEGSRLFAIRQIDFDRILHVDFSAYDGESLSLIIEIMGKHSNVILTKSSGRILGAIKLIGHQKNRYREILPGKEYVPPPSQDKANPLDITKVDFDTLLKDTFPNEETAEESRIATWLSKTFTGISPFAAREIAVRSSANLKKLSDEFVDFFSHMTSKNYVPVLITDDTGRTIGFYPFPSLQHAPANQHERQSVNTLADIYYTSVLPKQAFEQAKEQLITRLHREVEARRRSLEVITKYLNAGDKAQRFKQVGELILSQSSSIQENTDFVELIDYYDPGGLMVKVDLDRKLSAMENAEAYFKKYRKAVSGVLALQDRLAETEQQLRFVERALDAANKAESLEMIAEISSHLESKDIGIRQRESAGEKQQKPEFEGFKIGKVVSNGWEILVGQNSEANDYLIKRIAKPTDIWLHVKASPSAHVVIRTNGKPDAVPRSVLYAAAEQAAQHSDSKHSSLIPVDYTQRKYVRKPRGAAPGRVTYQNEKTIYVNGI